MFTELQKQWIRENLWNIRFYTYALDLSRSAYLPLGDGCYQDIYKKILTSASHQKLFQDIDTQHSYDLICNEPNLLELADVAAVASVFVENMGHILPLPEQSKNGKKTILLGDLDIDAITQNISLQKTLLLHISFFLKFFGFSLIKMDPIVAPGAQRPQFTWDPHGASLLQSDQQLTSFCQIITRILRLLFLVGLNNYAKTILNAVMGENSLLPTSMTARISEVSRDFWRSEEDWAVAYHEKKNSQHASVRQAHARRLSYIDDECVFVLGFRATVLDDSQRAR